MSTSTPIRIGTRGSPLALAQTHMVQGLLAAAHPHLAQAGAIEVVVIKTTGDLVQDRTLAEIGGKGLFTKEIDEAMLDGRIDLAVHSMKDVATALPDGIVIGAMLEREDPRDAFLSLKAASLAELPAGAVVGTASLRRGAQILHRRPDLTVVPLRGNVQTRMTRLAEGQVDATLLAIAGLKRLGLSQHATAILGTDDMLPAVAQGAVGVACRSGDRAMLDLLAALDHADTRLCVEAERVFLAVLDGSCRTPIAGLAEVRGSGDVRFRGLVVRPDGKALATVERVASTAELASAARDAGNELLARAPDPGPEGKD